MQALCFRRGLRLDTRRGGMIESQRIREGRRPMKTGKMELSLLLLLMLLPGNAAAVGGYAVQEENRADVGALLVQLVLACETPDEAHWQREQEALARIRQRSEIDYTIVSAVAEHWRDTYLNSAYRLYLHGEAEAIAQLEMAGARDSGDHALIILGFELHHGEMAPELVGRCNAAAALAKALPHTILVCSGGATGSHNKQQHTEAGLMKDYLVNACGIESERIFIDERAMTTADNAVNTYVIMQEHGVTSMTIVTSSYHQRWGQALYNAVGALYRQQYGYAPEIIGNYCYDIETDNPVFRNSARIALQQIAGVLGVPMNAG